MHHFKDKTCSWLACSVISLSISVVFALLAEGIYVTLDDTFLVFVGLALRVILMMLAVPFLGIGCYGLYQCIQKGPDTSCNWWETLTNIKAHFKDSSS